MARWVGFALIWTAPVVLTVDGLKRRAAKISDTVVDHAVLPAQLPAPPGP
jgi:hypothetical protein